MSSLVVSATEKTAYDGSRKFFPRSMVAVILRPKWYLLMVAFALLLSDYLGIMTYAEETESLHKLVSRTKELARRIDKMKSEETEIVETYKVNIKLPPFWIESPDIWFHQVEAQFLINNIKTENTKFNYLIAQLDPKYVENLWDIITSKEINKYSEAKERLLRIFKDGESKRIRKLLSGI
ncbi:hypothetical protein LAZ67_5003874 [Cordylochernes scorpioides]|uniref:DUF7041 domain-containing protein n=1 Tax=Cordylochernes scorpioides TaxID=51811 RepID=A0ABY6KKP1_9ARAC|nr:hypothetical protein LAZ67_5003874 [Cordylochernes scorpioides]